MFIRMQKRNSDKINNHGYKDADITEIKRTTRHAGIYCNKMQILAELITLDDRLVSAITNNLTDIRNEVDSIYSDLEFEKQDMYRTIKASFGRISPIIKNNRRRLVESNKHGDDVDHVNKMVSLSDKIYHEIEELSPILNTK